MTYLASTTRLEPTVRRVHKAIDLLTPGECRDLANTLMRAEWGVALEELACCFSTWRS